MNNKSKYKFGIFEGKVYLVIGIAKYAITGEKLILCKEENSDDILAVPESSWSLMVEHIGKRADCTFDYIEQPNLSTAGARNGFYNNYVILFELISNYLTEMTPPSLSMEQLAEYDFSELRNDMRTLCEAFFSTIQDYQFMPKVIGFNRSERREAFRQILFNFDHLKILKNYNEDSLFDAFCNSFPVNNKESKTNSWRRYAKGILSVCRYLSRFKDIQEFNDYCNSFQGDIALPEKMSREISGMGFPLACNLLKDVGFTDYCKPDIHLKDVLSETGYCSNDDRSVFNCIKAIASANGVKAMTVDSRIWLICSGNYYKHNISIPSHKKELIDKINGMNKLNID